MSRKIICFLHDIVESFSSMINVAFAIFEIVQLYLGRYLDYILSMETRGLHRRKHR